MTNEDIVQALYGAILDRPPDHGGREAFLAALEQGAALETLVRQFLESEEYAAKIRRRGGADVSDAFVRQDRRPILELLALLVPHDVAGCAKIRVGRDNDGGYVMVDDFAGLAAAYSLGIADDVSWDRQIADLGLDVFQYDHSILRLPETHVRFHWHCRRIVGARSDDPATLTVAEALRENGHAKGSDCLLKIDVEGTEWDILAAIEPDVLRVFRQIVCEIHGLAEAVMPARRARMHSALANLTAHHRVVHVHGNNWSPWVLIGGAAVPDVLEVTLMRIDDRRFAPTTTTFPTILDQPNDPERADFQLGHFRFECP